MGRTLQHACTTRGIELACMRHGTRSRRPSVRSDNIKQNDWGPAFPRLLPRPPSQTYLDLALEAAIRQQVPTALGACLNSYASINRPQAAEQVPTRGSRKARSWAVGCLRVNKPLPFSPCAAAGWLPSMHAEHAALLQKLALGGCARNHAPGVLPPTRSTGSVLIRPNPNSCRPMDSKAQQAHAFSTCRRWFEAPSPGHWWSRRWRP